VAADAGNGMASVLLPLLAEKLPVTLDVLFGTLDGRFPNHGSDPALSRNQRQLKAKLKAGKYDFGIGFDGDGDRIAFHDERGRYINSAVIGALIADRMLQKEPGASIGYTVLTSKIYEETIRAAGGQPVPVRVGHAFIKESMRQKDILFACEHSAHFYYKKYFYTDSVTITLLEVMEAVAQAKATGKTLSALVQPYCKYQQTEDVIVKVKDKKLALAKTEAYLKTLQPKKLRRFDGLVVDFGEVWGAVKPSVTEFALKIMFESTKKAWAKERQQQLVEYIESIAQDER
jgi:phosphomannomutase